MARAAIDWTRLDPDLRRMARCGFSIKRQARKLNLSERSIKKRRSALGLTKKPVVRENTGHAS
jgi:DNA-binding NarL/FixJ family response regulator